MDESICRRVLITEADLHQCARVVESRFEDGALEEARMQLSREFLAAAAALEHAARSQSRWALVNHRGTRGAHDLDCATEVLFEALFAYASCIREIAARFRDTELRVAHAGLTGAHSTLATGGH